ncbi:MAG: ferredoxin--NADP reductase [Rhodobacteraceae bacterium]|nr:ferredoxin--NADP reductase [Paracoccaceae bacterium]
MALFYDLDVIHVDRTIRDAVVVSLKARDAGVFAFKPGQYLTFSRDFDGVEVRRSYSICVPPGEGYLQVGIKTVDGGAFSTWANTELAAGQQLRALPPQGRFFVEPDPGTSRHYLMFAGGSGITPVLSLLRTYLRDEPGARITLVYANRVVHSIMFREDIEDLKNIHMDRLSVIHVLESDGQDIELFTGRVDGEKCAALFATLIDLATVDYAFICGPEPMMVAIRDSLAENGFAKERIKYELFAGSRHGRAKQAAKISKDARSTGGTAIITLDGTRCTVKIAPGQTLLQAALDGGLAAPHACCGGVCSTCVAKVQEGEVEMIANHALEDYEIRAGYVLTCQAVPISRCVVLEYEARA